MTANKFDDWRGEHLIRAQKHDQAEVVRPKGATPPIYVRIRQEQFDLILPLVRRGLSASEIMRETGLGQTRVYYLCQHFGVKVTNLRNREKFRV